MTNTKASLSPAADKAITQLENHLGEINALNEFLKQKLTEKQDWNSYAFGGSKPRPTLLKGGAEKVAKLIGVNQVTFDIHIQETPTFAASVTCNMASPTGSCQGVGYATAAESKWAKYDTATKTYVPQPNTYNTVLKIAKKRAYVDCVLTMAGLSGYFTQDLEDMVAETKTTAKTDNVSTPVAKSAPKTTKTTNKTDAAKKEPVQLIDEDTGEIVSEDGVDGFDGIAGWDDLISDSELFCTYCGESVSEKVRDYSKQKYGKVVCYHCQQAQKGANNNG